MARILACLATIGLCAGAAAADAQQWPDRPVSLVVTQGAGSSPDTLARLVADRLSKSLGQPVIVENKLGAANVIGAQYVARAAPDGYTFLFATSAALVMNPFMVRNLSYDTERDFKPVGFVSNSNQFLVGSPTLKENTLADLIASDKAKPGAFTVAVDGARYLSGVTALALNRRAGTNFVLVPYANISAGLQETLAGHTQLGVFSVALVESLIQSGQLKGFGFAADRRRPSLPNVATISETLPGFDLRGWFMITAPKDTPDAIVQKLNSALNEALGDPLIRARAPALGFELNADGANAPGDASRFLKAQLALWRETLSGLSIEAE